MIQKKIKVINPTGLDLCPAGVLCKESMKFKAKIMFSIKGKEANAKSVLSVLGACVNCGDELLFTFDGVDEKEALKNIEAAIKDGLGE